MAEYGLPVLMYHHINDHVRDLVTISPSDFAGQMEYLARRGYQTLDLEQSLACLRGRRALNGRQVLLTFDDGFLDNWVYAYPILRKYGLRAVIFLATCFVQPQGPPRPHLGEVWEGKIKPGQLPAIKRHRDFDYRGVMVAKNGGFYLSWPELVRMQDEGVIDVQPHGHFHGQYFSSARIVGFNDNPRSRVSLATGGDSRPGIPLYEQKPALLARRYHDDRGLRDYLAAYVQERGGESFFSRPRQVWRRELQDRAGDYIRRNGLQDGYESSREYEERIREDLSLCKMLIESKLGKKCLGLAWPWGAYDERLLRLARELGYQAAFSTERGSNLPGEDLMRLKRCVVKKGDLGWFARQLFIYSRPGLSRFYLKVRGRI